MSSSVFASFALLFSLQSIATVHVKVEQGVLDGVVSHSRNGFEFHSFYGIPYAKPPIGELRFEPPEEADPWKGIRDAKTPPPTCIQPSLSNFHKAVRISGQEDCLYLNVYTPNITSATPLPVMVYVHGGAFYTGNTFSIGPEYLMDHPVIVVTIQYRLGIFGFLSAADEILPGNYGMKDQTAALKWIQKNIAAFGGDPKRVTLVGESAGAGSVHFHLHSPLSTGLFHQAILQSGSSLGVWALMKSETARNRAHALGVLTGCPKLETTALVECLKKVPAEQLVEAHNKFFVYDQLPTCLFTPVVESESVPNAFLTRNVRDQSPINSVPLIAGVTKNEGGFVATRIRSIPKVLNHWNRNYDRLMPLAFHYADAANASAVSESIKKFYFGDDDIGSKTGAKLSEMFMDGYILLSTLEAARRHNNKVFFYLYDHRNNRTFNEFYGNLTGKCVCHTDELISLFHLRKVFPPVTEGPDLAISQRFVNYWVNFLRAGDPNNGTGKIWQPFAKKFEYLHMKTDEDKMEEKLFYDRYNFWKNVLPYA